MTIDEWLKSNTMLLDSHNIPTSRLDLLVLLSDELGLTKIQILSNTDYKLKNKNIYNLDQQIQKRINHIPLAYIRGKTEFYGREFIINENVLEPRPESETMIDILKDIKNIDTIIDIGTGSGAIAITAALEKPKSKVLAVDIDQNCIQVSKINNKIHRTEIKFTTGNLFDPYLKDKYKTLCILANLPYVPDSYTLNQAAMNEPKIAIFGGQDGLDLYRQLFNQLKNANYDKLHVLTESLPFQHDKLEAIAKDNKFKLYKKEDFIQYFTN